MAVSDEKTRTLITILKTDKELLENIAEKENRSFNQQVNHILQQFLKDQSAK